VKLEMPCPRLLAVSARIKVAVWLLTLARSSAALNSLMTIGTEPRLVILGEQRSSKLDSTSAAILVNSSDEVNSSSAEL